MSYREISGNIFNSNADVLVNTVNCVGVMGKGIALDFKRRYPKMFQAYQRVCQNGGISPGEILPYRKENPWILNFAIKDHWRQPSKIEWIESCLEKFEQSYRAMGIKSAAFPWMGAMNGGLPLEKIQEITRAYLRNLSDIDVEVYTFDKDASEPLFERLKKIVNMDIDIKRLSERSGIQVHYMEKIINRIRKEKVGSLPRLIESNGIGKTTIDKLYAFLIDDSKSDPGSFHERAQTLPF